jgi:hypothetical protein
VAHVRRQAFRPAGSRKPQFEEFLPAHVLVADEVGLARFAALKPAELKRVELIEGNVLTVAPEPADLLLAMAIGSPADAQELRKLASRVAAVLTRLIARGARRRSSPTTAGIPITCGVRRSA